MLSHRPYIPRKIPTASTCQSRHQSIATIPSTPLPKPIPPPPPLKSQSASKKVPSTALSFYLTTSPPTTSQLNFAARFFLAHKPTLLFSATKFRNVEFSSAPEVAFLGRSNVGKSSLLNALMGQKICHTSSKPGRTRSMNAFAVGGTDAMGNKGRLTVLDMPGYGKGSREEWGPEILKYLIGRKELRRTFLLIDPLHGLKSSDKLLLQLLRHHAISHQVILSKVDRVLPLSKPHQNLDPALARLKSIVESIRQEIQPPNDGPPARGEILACTVEGKKCGGEMAVEMGGYLGINAVRWAVMAATGLNQRKAKGGGGGGKGGQEKRESGSAVVAVEV